MTDLLDRLRSLLAPITAESHTPAQHEQLAQALRLLADEYDRRAAALRRQSRRPPAQRLTPRSERAGPGRKPARFIRIDRTEKPGRIAIYFGRGLWYELGSPERFNVQRINGKLVFHPADDDVGFAVYAGSGTPRIWADGARDLVQEDDGRYSAVVHAGAIVLDQRENKENE